MSLRVLSRLQLFMLSASLVTLFLSGCTSKNDSSAAAPVVAGKFSATDALSLRSAPLESRFTLIALTAPGRSSDFAELAKSHGAKIRVAHEKTGIVIAENVNGSAAFAIETSNHALGTSAYASKLALDRTRDYAPEFKQERLNPDTGLDMDPTNIVIDRSATNAQMPTHEMGVLDFEKNLTERFGVAPNGDSVILAVLDTGVDIAHKDVFQDRIVQSYDMTSEGKIKLLPAVFNDGKLGLKDPTPNSKRFVVSDSLRSSDDIYYLGEISEASYSDEENSGDLDQDGSTKSIFPVLLVKTSQGLRAIIDVNLNDDFSDDTVLRDYESSQDTVIMDRARTGLVRLNVNIPRKADGTLLIGDDKSVTLNVAGFDGGQHGTHVAGIAAGRFDGPQFGGQFRGGAPHAKILGIKVLGKRGGADADIIEGITLAIDKGARVINMSLGSGRRPTDGLDTLATTIDQVANRTDVIFMISAGNRGPGINSIGSPSTAGRALSIGAYTSGATWRDGYNVPGAPMGHFIWSFSSTGPMDTGEIRPTLLAPGAAYSSIPLARAPGANSGYDVFQGTSMAAPAAAGAAVLFLDALHKIKGQLDLPTDGLNIARALVEGAQDLNVLNKGNTEAPFYTRVEQGAGLLNLPAAFAALEKRVKEKAVGYIISTTSLKDTYEKEARGVYTTSRLPDRISFTVRKRPEEIPDINEHNFNRTIQLVSDAVWVAPEIEQIGINGLNKTTVGLKVDQDRLATLPYGVHNARIKGLQAENGQLEFIFDITYIKARELTQTQNRDEFLETNIRFTPGGIKRYHFFVGPNRSRFSVSLSVPEFDSVGQIADGRYRMSIYDPTGAVLFDGPYARGTNPRVDFGQSNPMPGVWEIVLYRSFAAANDTTSAILRFSTENLVASPAVWNDVIAPNSVLVQQKFRITNYGRTVTPVTQLIAHTIKATAIDVPLKSKEKQLLSFTVPSGLRRLVIRTDEVKDNPSADIDLKLLDSKGNVIGTSGQGSSSERIEVQVQPGDVLSLEIDAFDLGSKSEGRMDIFFDFKLPFEIHGTAETPVKPLAWGKSIDILGVLDVSPVPETAVSELRGQFSRVTLVGELSLFDGRTLVEKQVGAVPLDLGL